MAKLGHRIGKFAGNQQWLLKMVVGLKKAAFLLRSKITCHKQRMLNTQQLNLKSYTMSQKNVTNGLSTATSILLIAIVS